MKNFTFPAYFNKLAKKENVNLCHEGVADVVVSCDSDIPALAVKRVCADGFTRLCFCNGAYRGYFTYAELRKLESDSGGKIVKVYEAYEVRDKGFLFENFVDDFYHLKENAKEDRDFWKLFLNSLYGKFGQKIDSERRILTKEGRVISVKKSEKRHNFRKVNVIIASYITAYARLYLHSLLEKCGADNIVYCDTDSIHTLKQISTRVKGLGELEKKGEGKGTYVRSKFYIFENQLVLKGVNKIISADDMKRLIASNKVELISDLILRLRSSARRHKPLLSVVSQSKKFSTRHDDKRVYISQIDGKDLLENFTDSQAVEINGMAT